ncbi:hypothetical protein [Chryseobacterium nematophagum]|uniref:hypothetical protein n=1 Tax=Chryseobacterium nematophagum TaxID=2305228 RepID=UPI0016052CD3|nr:hypothetical protein [Chryseobacterium nematophagum]
MKNLKVEELSSYEMKNVEGGYWSDFFGTIGAIGWGIIGGYVDTYYGYSLGAYPW